MSFLALGFVLLLAMLGIAYLIVHVDARVLARVLKIAAAIAVAMIGLVFALRGGIGMAIAAAALAFSILAGRKLQLPFGRGAPPSGGQTSRVRSAALEMELDHDSGELDGRILCGRFEGRSLSELSDDDLLAFAAEITDDSESAALLEAYFDRRFPGWREDVHADDGAGQGGPAHAGTMTDDEAYQILGVSPGASKSDIVSAHRRLMQKVHPDRGGSSFLAAKINEAKDRLLGKHGSTRTQH